MKKVYCFVISSLVFLYASGQAFSVSTDLALMRNLSPQQKFWAIGQTITGELHLSSRHTAYAWLSYFSPGKFENHFTAHAISPATVPASIRYRVRGTWKSGEVSFGWKPYITGSFNENTKTSIYARLGFGLMFSEAQNTIDPAVDTSRFALQPAPVEGSHRFNRLTFDLALGGDYPLGGGFFAYGELRTLLPASDYPSPALHNPKNVPLPVIAAFGLRFMFNY